MKTLNDIDKEYLSRPLVHGVVYEISDESINISCSHTVWVQAQRAKYIRKEDVEQLYSNVYSTAKEMGITIGRSRHYKKFINTRWQEYREQFDKYNKVFSELVVVCKEVQKRGIHTGYSDDWVVSKAFKIRNIYMEMYYRTSICSQVYEMVVRLKELESALKNPQLYHFERIEL